MNPPTPPATLAELTELANRFRDERNWRQFHNPKDAALSLTLEVAEILEHMQWKNGPELLEALRANRSEFADELADALYWIIVLADDLQIDLGDAFKRKLLKNAQKYPIDKAKGQAKKYTEL